MPISLSEIHDKLNNNYYLNEFEFANDCRLVYANCQVYNEEHSPLWLLSVEIVKSFDMLFCDWILNSTPCDHLKPSEPEKKNAEVGTDCKGIGWDKWQAMPVFMSSAYKSLNKPGQPIRIPGPSKPTCVSGKVNKKCMMGWEPANSLPAGWMQAFKSMGAKLNPGVNEVNDEDFLPGVKTNANR